MVPYTRIGKALSHKSVLRLQTVPVQRDTLLVMRLQLSLLRLRLVAADQSPMKGP